MHKLRVPICIAMFSLARDSLALFIITDFALIVSFTPTLAIIIQTFAIFIQTFAIFVQGQSGGLRATELVGQVGVPVVIVVGSVICHAVACRYLQEIAVDDIIIRGTEWVL